MATTRIKNTTAFAIANEMSKQPINFSSAFATTKDRNNAYIKLSDYFPTYKKVLIVSTFLFLYAHMRVLY